MNKAAELQILKEKALKDKKLPLAETATELVFGEGDPNSKVYFLGEAPGRNEDVQGRPFVGRAGKLLDQLIESVGLQRSDVWISNVVYFRPPENRAPTPGELWAFSKYVDAQLEIIKPEIIVTLGRFSLIKFLPERMISEVHGQPQKKELNGREVTILPMYHPSAGLRATRIKKVLEDDFKKNKKLLNT